MSVLPSAPGATGPVTVWIVVAMPVESAPPRSTSTVGLHPPPATRSLPPAMRIWLGAGGLALAALGAWCALPALGTYLVAQDPLPPSADAIVVLAGSVRDRAHAAAMLYRKGLAPRVIVTRETQPPGSATLRAAGVELPESDELTRRALQDLGVPPAAITTLRRRAQSTASEARTIARWACANH